MEPEKAATQSLVLDLASFQIIREGQPVRLEKTPMELFRLLVRRRGTLVTREEIVAAIWGDEVHVDVEAGINTAIRKIRQALEDNADAPRYLETVVGRGYRFVGPIEVVDPEVPVRSATPAPSKRSGPWIWIALAMAGLAVILLFLKFTSHRATSAAANHSHLVIGVVPLQNLSEEPGQDYFADGLTDEILTQLGQLNPERLSVVRSRASATAPQGKATIPELSQNSGLQYLIEGSVRRQHEQARISVRLLRVTDQTTLWTESFDRRVADVLSLQSEIAQRIGSQLQIQVLSRANKKPVAPEVVEAYLRGRFEMNARGAPDAARAYFERAAALDPSYAPAEAGLADFYRSRAINNDEGAAEAWRLAEQHASKALSLDPESAETHTSIAEIKLMHDWDWHAAREHAQRALQLNPSSPEAHGVYARYLRVAGNIEEAVNQRKQARALDPNRADLSHQLALEYFFARDYQSEVALARRIMASNPDNSMEHGDLCAALGYLKQYDESVAECSKVLAAEGHADWIPAFEQEYHRHGYEAANSWIGRKESKEILKHPQPDLWDLANAYILAGMREEAMLTLLRGIPTHEPGLLQIRVDPDFDPIRDDPRYAELVRQIGFPSE
jgi:TolB-like protein/DNA-binding winged helix-turn-helix (wHTH) protein